MTFFFSAFFSHPKSRSLLAGGLFYVITLSEALVLTSEIIAAAVALLHSASLARAIRVAFPVLTRSVIVFWGELIDLLLSSSLNGINANEILWEKCKKRALKCLSTEPPSQTQVCLCGITILDDVWRSFRSHRFYTFNNGLQRTVF